MFKNLRRKEKDENLQSYHELNLKAAKKLQTKRKNEDAVKFAAANLEADRKHKMI